MNQVKTTRDIKRCNHPLNDYEILEEKYNHLLKENERLKKDNEELWREFTK